MGEPRDIRIYGIVHDTIVDGPGLRVGVFVQGCGHGCPGCHNPESQPREGGSLRTTSEVVEEVRSNPLVRSVTLSGGEPFDQADACAEIARELKGLGYSVWAYSGYLYEDLAARAVDDGGVAGLLGNIDVLVDGPFVESLKSLELKWRGSSNQRLVDVPATRRRGEVVLWEQPSFVPKKPASW